MNVLGIIPARYDSTRFPGKPLVIIDGKSMIERVYRQAGKADRLTKVVVATDNREIFDHVKGFGGEVIMTSHEHANGTSRCEEVLETLKNNDHSIHFECVVNIQGDEPYIDPSQINSVVSLFENPDTEVGTLIKRIHSADELFNPNVVKVVFGKRKNALYFSRQAIPMHRDVPEKKWVETADYYKHIGIYGYRADILTKLVKLETGKLESAEKLEQLRWLENGFKISLQITEFESIAIDTPADLLKLTNKN